MAQTADVMKLNTASPAYYEWIIPQPFVDQTESGYHLRPLAAQVGRINYEEQIEVR